MPNFLPTTVTSTGTNTSFCHTVQSIGRRRCCCKCCMYRVPHIFCASLFHAPHCLNIDSLNSPTTEHFHLKVAINDSNFTEQPEVKINLNLDLLFAHLAMSRPRLPRRDLPRSTGAARNFAWQRALLRTACRLRRREGGRRGPRPLQGASAPVHAHAALGRAAAWLYCFLSSSEAAERKKEGERKMSTLNAAKIEYRAAPRGLWGFAKRPLAGQISAEVQNEGGIFSSQHLALVEIR